MTVSEVRDAGPVDEPDAGDLDALRARYRAERDRRRRPDGDAQYVPADGRFAADPWAPARDGSQDRAAVHDEVDALVIGAGFGGLAAGARLREAGLERIRLVDTASDVGGAWYWNRYPGVACDTESYVYLPLLEETGTVPSRKYTPGAENRRHAQAIARRYDLYRDALLGTEVTSLGWDDAAERWRVRTDRGDEVAARYVVGSGGVLDRPKLPGLPGIDTFRGHLFHTSRWDYDYTGGDPDGAPMDRLADRRVAIVGTGATAIQAVPHLARDAAHLDVVQRTPSTIDTRDDRPTDPGWWDTLPPGWQQRRRDNFLALLDGRDEPEDLVADRWTDTAPVRGVRRLRRTAGREDPAAALELADAEKMDELRARVDAVVDDPATAAALKPWYRQMCKRPAFSDRYLQAFNRDDVTLVDTGGRGVERLTPDGYVVGGVERRVDAIVFATGFSLGADPAARARADIRGRDGRSLAEHWSDGLRTFHGWVTRGFPNLFHLGVSQNASSPNFVHHLEEQATHVASVVAEAEQQGALVEPSAAAEDGWVATIREGAVDQHAFLAECTPGYYNGEGRPRRTVESFGGGAVAFHALLRDWREGGDHREVLVPPRAG